MMRPKKCRRLMDTTSDAETAGLTGFRIWYLLLRRFYFASVPSNVVDSSSVDFGEHFYGTDPEER